MIPKTKTDFALLRSALLEIRRARNTYIAHPVNENLNRIEADIRELLRRDRERVAATREREVKRVY